MAKLNFYLKEPESKKETPIYMRISFGNTIFKLYSGQSLFPKYWNFKKQIVKRNYTGSFEINSLLNAMKTEVEAMIRNDLALNKKIEPEKIRERFNAKFKNKFNIISFYDWFEKFIEVHKPVRTHGVIKNYKTTINKLKRFEADTNTKVTYENITNNFYNKFIHYLIIDNGLLNNSAGKYIKILKTFMNWSVKKGLTENMAFKDFKVFNEDTDAIYLTQEELDKIEELDLSNNKKLSNVRDLFLLEYYTGLRYSDVSNLKSENIKNDFLIIKNF